MADAADVAAEIEEQSRNASLAARQRVRSSCISRTFCIDCDDVIPHQRRALGRVLRCVGCQQLHELRARR